MHLPNMLALPRAAAEPARGQVKSRDPTRAGNPRRHARAAAPPFNAGPTPGPYTVRTCGYAAWSRARVRPHGGNIGRCGRQGLPSAQAQPQAREIRGCGAARERTAGRHQRPARRYRGCLPDQGDLAGTCQHRGRVARRIALQEAMDHALARVTRAVRKSVQQRRTACRREGCACEWDVGSRGVPRGSDSTHGRSGYVVRLTRFVDFNPVCRQSASHRVVGCHRSGHDTRYGS